MSRIARTLLLAAIGLCLVAPSARAAPNSPLLADLWTTVLETPSAENPFVTGDPVCLRLGRNIVAPFAPSSPEPQDFTCTVKRGTKIFVAASSFECSTFAGDTPVASTTEAALRMCAQQNDLQAPRITVDGRPLPVTEVETRLLRIHLPTENVFGLAGRDRRGRSVAHGWVALLKRLKRGTHTIQIDLPETSVTTTIIVK